MNSSLRLLRQNRLLSSLSSADQGLMAPHLKPLDLPIKYVVHEADRPIGQVVFPYEGVCSIVAHLSDGRRLEVGLFGRDGMSGCPLMLGVDQAPHETFVQVAGKGACLPTATFLRLVGESASLRAQMLRYVQVTNVQTAQTAAANAIYTVEQRLARWLLMCDDRIDGPELHLTHEFLSVMLGVRRSSVTVSLQLLETSGLIDAKRGRVIIIDRQGLLQTAGDSYGVPEAEYERLIGSLR